MAAAVDRASALKEFDDTKAGVRGLIESGVTTVPSIFRLPAPLSAAAPSLAIPTVDLSLPSAADLVCAAARDWGFLQIINHGIPAAEMDAAVAAVRAFHEMPAEDRAEYYTRGPAGGVSYFSNVDLFRSSTASWRDTLQIATGPNPPDLDRIPAICRSELISWDEHVVSIGRRLLAMLSKGIGVDPHRLENLSCLQARVMVCHYYPMSPEPDLTMGLRDHTDPGVLTVLLQDQIGGLQVKRRGKDGGVCWVDVKPVDRAIVINVGDLLQARHMKWMTYIPSFKVLIKYKKEVTNKLADMLSCSALPVRLALLLAIQTQPITPSKYAKGTPQTRSWETSTRSCCKGRISSAS